MNAKRFYFVMVGVIMLSIVGGAGMLYIANGLLEKRSATVVDLKLQNMELEEQKTAFRAAKTDVEKYQYLKEIISKAVPQDKDQARTVREIFTLAEQSGIRIRSVQFPSSSLGTKAPRAAATPTPESGAAAAPASPTPVPVSQAKAVDGLPGVFGIETQITPYADGKSYRVTYDQLVDFLRRIESNRRTMQITNIHINPLGATAAEGISFTLTVNIFIKP